MKKKILLVEDDNTLAEGLKIIFDDEGYEVVVFSDGKDINKEIRNFDPDVILLDYLLPREDGGMITKRLRLQENTMTIPIILMSASQKNMHKFAKDVGANAFLAKPFEISNLISLVEFYSVSPSA